jgi:hypothetical protein
MPTHQPPRRITIHKVPYNFERSRASVTCYSKVGEYLVPAEVADDATAQGYATEGWASDSRTRTTKGGPRRRRAPSSGTSAAKSATTAANAATDNRSDAGMGGTHLAADDRASAGQPVAPAAD